MVSTSSLKLNDHPGYWVMSEYNFRLIIFNVFNDYFKVQFEIGISRYFDQFPALINVSNEYMPKVGGAIDNRIPGIKGDTQEQVNQFVGAAAGQKVILGESCKVSQR